MNASLLFDRRRLLPCCRGDIGAWALLARHARGSIRFPGPLSALSTVADKPSATRRTVGLHPAMLPTPPNHCLQWADEGLRISATLGTGLSATSSRRTVFEGRVSKAPVDCMGGRVIGHGARL